jgi:hypothetical protein
MGYEPALAGALTRTDATPAPFVLAVSVTPLRVKLTLPGERRARVGLEGRAERDL